MRRAAIFALLLATGCGGRERDTAADATNRQATIDDFVGTWEGTVSPAGSTGPAAATIELMATPNRDAWSFTVVSAADPTQHTTSPARVTHIEGDSVVVAAGPFASVLSPGEQVTTHSVYRLRGDTLVGNVHAIYGSGREIMLDTRATRRP